MIEQEDIINGITAILTELKSITRVVVILAIIFWWAGFSENNPIKIIEVEIQRKHALFIAEIIYLGITYIVWDRFHRLGSLLIALKDENFETGLSKVFIHTWILNPFSRIGTGLTSRIMNCKGFGSLSLIWWICNSSVYYLADDKMNFIAIIIQFLFFTTGLATMSAYIRINNTIINRIERLNRKRYIEINEHRKERIALDIIGTILGIISCALTQIL